MSIDPWEFCRLYFGLSEDAEELNTRDYKGKCNKMLAEMLAVSERTVKSWGARFESTPEPHRKSLARAYSLQVIFNEAPKHKDLFRPLLEDVLRKLDEGS